MKQEPITCPELYNSCNNQCIAVAFLRVWLLVMDLQVYHPYI